MPVNMPQGQPPSPPAEHPVCIFAVDAREGGARLDRFLAGRLRDSGLSREKIKRHIKEGKVLVNGSPEHSPKRALCPGDTVRVQAEPAPTALRPEEGALDIVYRDATLAVLNKPAGLTVHPAPGRPAGTLAHRLLAHFPELASQEGFRPGIVHRLDKDTSGLMLAALTEQCRLALAGQFARHEVRKEYLALVHGVPVRHEEVIEAPIGRHPTRKTRMAVTPAGKPAKSARRTLYADHKGRFSLQAIRIFSGRTHQVRVHMQHIGHPLLGDAVYGLPSDSRESGKSSCTAPRQMLHAWKLAFVHPSPPEDGGLTPGAPEVPRGDRFSFCCPPPGDFTDSVRRCLSSGLKVVVTGSPGCGKSLLLQIFRDAGFPVFSADAEVARLYAPGGDGHRLLRAHFGDRFVPGDTAPVNKAALGAAMREEDSLRREIEALLHPLVWQANTAFWQAHETGSPLAVAEVPLYFESGRNSGGKTPDSPTLIGVHCPLAVRRERLANNRGWSEETIAGMEAWQWPEEKKMRACDIVLDNTGSIEDFTGKAALLIQELHALRERRLEDSVWQVERLWSCE